MKMIKKRMKPEHKKEPARSRLFSLTLTYNFLWNQKISPPTFRRPTGNDVLSKIVFWFCKYTN